MALGQNYLGSAYLGGQPQNIYAASGNLEVTVTGSASPLVQVPLTANLAASMSGVATLVVDVFATGSLSATVTGSSSAVVKVPAMGNLQATLTGAGTLALGLPTAALSASVTGAGSFSVRVPETGNVAVSVVGGATLGVLVYPTGNLQVTVTGAATGLAAKFIATGNLLVSVTGTSIVAKLVVHAPSSQSGAVPTTFLLHEHYKIWVVVGVPPANMGNNGDLCYRKDSTTGSGTKVYTRASNAWTAIA